MNKQKKKGFYWEYFCNFATFPVNYSKIKTEKDMTIQFKIQIRGIKRPPVWRRIAIPGNFTFHDLHNTIQTAFGWWDEHLYQFQRHPYVDGWVVKEPDMEDDTWEEQPEDARKTNVANFIQCMGLEKFVYIYDFGDNWIHDIIVESIDKEAELEHPVCLAGKGACPSEDCGGIGGYEELKEDMDKEEINEFCLEDVNEELKSITAESEDRKDWNAQKDDDNEEDWQAQPAGGAPAPIKLANVVNQGYKGELVSFADELGLGINEKLSEDLYCKKYAKAVLANPVQVLKQLPLEDLLTLERLKKHPTKGNIVPVFDNYYESILIIYRLADLWQDNEGGFYIQMPEDLWKVMSPHIEEVLEDPVVQCRATAEFTVSGLTNLYGQVTVGFIEKEMIRLGMAATKEEAQGFLATAYVNSLLLKLTIHQTDDDTDPTNDNLLYLSRYGWDVPDELIQMTGKYKSKARDYKLFTEEEIMYAARTPVPRIANPAQKAFVALLTNDLKQSEIEAEMLCHDLWFREMHKFDRGFEDDSPGNFFRDYLIYECDCTDSLYSKAMRLLDDYLNNMPHWQLKGHTPKEVQELLSEEANAPMPKPRSRVYENDEFNARDWMFPTEAMEVTMPIVVEKKPGRNEPCPCGSGKKYKNCCGKGN